MKNQIKFAVVGLGHIGKRHAQVIQNNPEAKLISLADSNISIHKPLEERFEVPFYSSLDAMLNLGSNEKPEVINICTPNGEHADQTIKCLEKGFHVVCEKPLALTTRDCNNILEAANKNNKVVFCVMQNRYSPSAVWLKEITSSGILGKLHFVVVNCFWNRDYRYYNSSSWRGTKQLDGGTLFTQFSHFIDTILWLFGDVENIKSTLCNYNHEKLIEFEDSGFVHFNFVSGGNCSLNYSTSVWDRNFESSITIVAENGSIKVGGQYMNEVEYCHIKDYTMPILAPSLPPNDYGHYKGSAANHDFVIQNVIDYLKNKSQITTHISEGIRVVKTIEKIYAGNYAF